MATPGMPTPPGPAGVLEIERHEAFAVLWLSRPDALNAMGRAFFTELPAAVAELSEDDEVRAIVLAARGRHFCVGLDLKELGHLLGNRSEPAGETSAPGSATGDPAPGDSTAARTAARRREILGMQQALGAVASCPKPVIAAVHGHCIGGGMDLVTACDLRLAAADAVFSVRETRLGMVADLGTLQRLPRIVGGGIATELALTGRDLGAGRAQEVGFVSAVFADHEALIDAARDTAAELASLPPLAVQGTKSVLAASDGLSIHQGLEHVASWNAAMIESDDVVEAVTAFLERRPPRFTGR